MLTCSEVRFTDPLTPRGHRELEIVAVTIFFLYIWLPLACKYARNWSILAYTCTGLNVLQAYMCLSVFTGILKLFCRKLISDLSALLQSSFLGLCNSQRQIQEFSMGGTNTLIKRSRSTWAPILSHVPCFCTNKGDHAYVFAKNRGCCRPPLNLPLIAPYKRGYRSP